ncbi:MAG: ABC transporter ATP-binding protein, partial [Deltaproteobacteria bacterium]|nr:ABC transporter ATP-binding protein [Deltaproteobacteria bacterium]
MPLVPPKVTLGLAPAVPLLPASGGLGFLRRMLRRGLGLFGAEVLSFPLSSSGTPGPQRLENPLPGGSAATPTPPEPGGSLSQPAPVQELLIQGLSKRFNGAEWALRDFSLEVHRGELLCVLGPSGCGKTTLLRLIAGLDAPTRGLVQREGEVLSSPEGMVPPEHRRMGMVFQDYALFPHLSVLDNVRFGLELPPWQRALNWVRLLLGQQQATAAHRMDGLVELLNLTGLTDMTGRYPHELSGGQQQRVALARALATHPRLVLMDEPFSNLDATLRTRLRDEVKDVLHRAGATTLLVTHDQEEAINMGDRLAIMNGGKLEQIGTPEEVLERPASRFVAEFLGFTRCLPGTVKGEW